MRTRLFAVAGVLLLASATSVRAQRTPPVQPPAAPAAAEENGLGLIDLGFRGTDATGDEARLERYRDLSDGAASQINVAKETPLYNVTASAFNIGYRDSGSAAASSGAGSA